MSERERIKREIARFEAAGGLAVAATAIFGALKATELRQPRLVVDSLPALERALAAWSDAIEVDDVAPDSEVAP